MGEIQNDEVPSTSKQILLGGEDAMEEDEVLPSQELPTTLLSGESTELLSQIVSPSPFSEHNMANSRVRNALTRVTTHPTSDVEAWQALIMEANTQYRTLQSSNLHSVDAETHAKLDWIESCFGTLLKYFPYASPYFVSIVEMLIAQSARVGEEGGPVVDLGMDPSQRAIRCEAKVENIFRRVLGIEMDGTAIENNKLGGMCTATVELWLLYIKKRIRDANRHAISTLAASETEQRVKLIQEWTINAYEVSISHAGFVYSNDLLWKQYLAYVKSWTTTPSTTAAGPEHALAQKQMVQLRSIYQRLVSHPMTDLPQLWQEYEIFEKQQNEALATALIAEFAPKYQHARSVYLDRGRVFTVHELQIGRLATPPADSADEEYLDKIAEEHRFLTLWKKRTSFERTNPERLTPTDLLQRVRQAYKDMACVLTRYPEVWHTWSMWELLRSGGTESEKVDLAVSVLRLGQSHIPDSTLLAQAEAEIVELHTETPADCMLVMKRFVERNPNTLGYVLYQQLVRRYKGIQAARAIFAKARRVLQHSSGGESNKEGDTAGEAVEGSSKERGEGDGGTKSVDDSSAENGKRRLVTNRLGPTIGMKDKAKTGSLQSKTEAETNAISETTDEQQNVVSSSAGVITWHLYASHAALEHRLNRSPEVAARVYELGLRKHVSFLTTPPFVQRYAQLLLELQDTENLRALLTRAIVACESDKQDSRPRESDIAALWDMILRFESILSSTSTSSISALHAIEQRRHAALMGPDTEDVSTGGMINSNDPAIGIGNQRSTISEQLVRSEGYDISSRIINGMSRAVDVLEIMGLWGNSNGANSGFSQFRRNKGEFEDDLAGGKSDACYRRRVHYEQLAATGFSNPATIFTADGTAATAAAGSKVLSARDRLQQGAAGASAPSAPAGAAALLIQQSPEWVRPLLLLLPASRTKAATLQKPPPHLIEMALMSLRKSALPAERPIDSNVNESKKRKSDRGIGGEDSSDEEDGAKGGGGYGTQFRARQKARHMQNGGTTS